jgi:hypothetical protein
MPNPIEELSLVGKLREEVVVVGKKIAWHTLDSDEHISANSTASLWDPATRDHALKVETLARAIETIDGVPFSSLLKQEDKDKNVSVLHKAREAIAKWQRALTDHVFARYSKLVNRQYEQIEELEKNGPSPLTSTTATG